MALPPLVIVVVVLVCRTPSQDVRSSVVATTQPWCRHTAGAPNTVAAC